MTNQADRPEEVIAHQLANIGVRLYSLGLLSPYNHIVKARNSLLDILDGEFGQRPKSSKDGDK